MNNEGNEDRGAHDDHGDLGAGASSTAGPNPEGEIESPDGLHVHVIGIPGGGGRPGFSLNERHVHGSVLEQTRLLVEEYSKPELGAIEYEGAPDGSVPVYIDHNGVHVMDRKALDGWRDFPRFRSGVATLTDIDSFIAHANRFKGPNSVIFANSLRTSPSLKTVFDYHDAVEGAREDPIARHLRHQSNYAFPVSDEWTAWAASNGRDMTQVEFAQFLEDHIIDVIEPGLVTFADDDVARRFVGHLGGPEKIASPTALMDLAAGLQIHESSMVGEVTKLNSGEGSIQFTIDHQTTNAAGVKIIVPTMFAIGVPVFRNDAPYRILARLRYRKNGGRITFRYELWRTELVFDHAFEVAVEKVQNETALPIFQGSPEA